MREVFYIFLIGMVDGSSVAVGGFGSDREENSSRPNKAQSDRLEKSQSFLINISVGLMF